MFCAFLGNSIVEISRKGDLKISLGVWVTVCGGAGGVWVVGVRKRRHQA